MTVWSTFGPGWLEQGIQFIESQKGAATTNVANVAKPTSAPSHATTKPIAAPIDTPDATAAKALSLAKTYVSAQQYGLARQKLQKLIENYPTSPAAKEAKQLLADIANK